MKKNVLQVGGPERKTEKENNPLGRRFVLGLVKK
jgi:hypothetical protein